MNARRAKSNSSKSDRYLPTDPEISRSETGKNAAIESGSGDAPIEALNSALWITSPDARPWLDLVSSWDFLTLTPARVERLRGELGTARTRIILDVAEARGRGREKFQRAGELFFTRKAIEQATDEQIANWKGQRCGSAGSIVDIGCGAGGDLIGLSRSGAATGIEMDPVLAHFAAINCRIYGRNVEVRLLDASKMDVRDFPAWHCDPDRRPAGRRVSAPELGFPALATLERWCDQNPTAAIKLAPAAELPAKWQSAEREWIASRGECRQQVVWLGSLARNPSFRTATTLCSDGSGESFSGIPDFGKRCEWKYDISSRAGEHYIYDLSPAVRAAGLNHSLANHWELAAANDQGSLLAGNHHIQSSLAQVFRVLERIPFDRKRLNAALKAADAGVVEVKARNVPIDAGSLQRELAGQGSRALISVLIFRQGHSIVATIAERM